MQKHYKLTIGFLICIFGMSLEAAEAPLASLQGSVTLNASQLAGQILRQIRSIRFDLNEVSNLARQYSAFDPETVRSSIFRAHGGLFHDHRQMFRDTDCGNIMLKLFTAFAAIEKNILYLKPNLSDLFKAVVLSKERGKKIWDLDEEFQSFVSGIRICFLPRGNQIDCKDFELPETVVNSFMPTSKEVALREIGAIEQSLQEFGLFKTDFSTIFSRLRALVTTKEIGLKAKREAVVDQMTPIGQAIWEKLVEIAGGEEAFQGRVLALEASELVVKTFETIYPGQDHKNITTNLNRLDELLYQIEGFVAGFQE